MLWADTPVSSAWEHSIVWTHMKENGWRYQGGLRYPDTSNRTARHECQEVWMVDLGTPPSVWWVEFDAALQVDLCIAMEQGTAEKS